MDPAVRAAAERLLNDCEKAGSFGFDYEAEDMADIKTVARYALAGSHEAGTVETLTVAGDLMAKRLIQLESRHWRTEGPGPDRWQCLLCSQRSDSSNGSHMTGCPVHIWQSARAVPARACGMERLRMSDKEIVFRVNGITWTLAELAEGDEHLRWLIDTHRPADGKSFCPVCDTRAPCDYVSLAATGLARSSATTPPASAGEVRAANLYRDVLAQIVGAFTSGIYCANCGEGVETCRCIIDLARTALAIEPGERETP
jgi:hypothetical protein